VLTVVSIALVAIASAAGISPKPEAPGQFLTGPADGSPVEIVMAYISSNRAALGLEAGDLADIRITERLSAHSGVTHIEIRQLYSGIEVHQGVILANVATDGSIINLHNTFQSNLQGTVTTTEPALSASDAVTAAAGALGLGFAGPLVTISNEGGPQRRIVYAGAEVSRNDIPVKLVLQPERDGRLSLAWDLEILEMDQRHWWSLRVDADTGAIISRDDYVDNEDFVEQAKQAGHQPVPSSGPVNMIDLVKSEGASGDAYRVYEWPVESPNYAAPAPPADARTLAVDPASTTASPFGWHDTDGVTGPEYTTTQGNNADAQKSGAEADCGPTLQCDTPLDLTQAPTSGTNIDSAIINLFYWNNIIHDVWYTYGFDEVSGNFQVNNYGNGGLGGDSVMANCQAPGNCNATFGTPPDGSTPSMNMFLCDIASPSRDGSLDNGVIAHEYGHGISNRLTGGPSNVSCLNNTEQMGEGWSDWIGLVMTMEPGDQATDPRGIGTWLLGQGPGGPGVRQYRYSTDMGINPHTYGDVGSVAIPHGVGSIWAAMLWEVTWNLIDAHGFNPDIDDDWTAGGNNLAMQLITDGMKLQPCSPGFVDGRDAILAADLALTGGANECLIWAGFAKRGLGFSADQGSSSSVSDGTEAFDLPDACLNVLKLAKTANPSPATAGGIVEYTLTVTNDTPDTLTDVTVVDPIPADTTYVPGSATCGGVFSAGEVTFSIGTLASGASVPCTFEVQVDLGVGSTVFFFDDFESGLGAWTASGLWNPESESDSCGSTVAPFPSSTNAVYYGRDGLCDYDTGSTNSGTLTMNTPFALTGAAPELRLSSYEETEGGTTYDQRLIELSTDSGSTWSEIAQLATEGAWYERTVDLSPYIGNDVLLRFHFDTVDDIANDYFGWMIDDVEVIDEAAISNSACVTAAEGDNACASVVTPVEAAVSGFEVSIDETNVDVCAGTDAVLDADVISTGGTLPVTLSSMSSPGGAAVSFGTNPVVPTGVSTVTVTAPAADYTITIEGDDGVMTSSDDFTVTVLPLASASAPMAPGDGAVDVYRPTNFEWSVDVNATDYLLEVASDAGFGDIVYSAGTSLTTHRVWTLESATTYHWRVTPSNGCGAGATSAAFSFTTESTLFEDGFESGDVSPWDSVVPPTP
jgi:uncharacterized repeat protein (TIGR01451 family)